MEAFIRQLPKTELHLHIESTLSPETILALADRNGVDFPYRSVAEFDSGHLSDLLIGVQAASGYSRADLVRFMRNAFEGSWLSRPAKDAYLESLLDYAAAHGVMVS